MVQIYTDDSRKFEKIIFLTPYTDIYPFKHNFSRSNNCLSEPHQLYSFTRCFIEFVSCLFKDFLLFFNTTIKSSCYPEWCEVTWNFSWYLMSNITRIELLTLSINKFASPCFARLEKNVVFDDLLSVWIGLPGRHEGIYIAQSQLTENLPLMIERMKLSVMMKSNGVNSLLKLLNNEQGYIP